uniref:Uncharacterized protein n=1 Tax=Ackermannviridae sp. TaxID=2831612 RepID=A0A8S5RRB0_9CAUD|nr:MAG TPA: hypothetical protein [Ackermannviridae sp.]
MCILPIKRPVHLLITQKSPFFKMGVEKGKHSCYYIVALDS